VIKGFKNMSLFQRDRYTMRWPKKIIRDSLTVFLLALFIRTIYSIFFVESEYLSTEDQVHYIQLANFFSTTGFLGVDTSRMPGYPLFISSIYTVFGESLWNVISIQILLDSASCVVMALMAQSIFSKGFWTAGILSAINLNMIILSASLLTDTLFLFLFILFLFFLLQYLKNENIKPLFLSVLFISLATLVRSSSYYLLPVLLIGLVIWRFWRRDTIFRVVTLLVLCIAVAGILLGSIYQRNYQYYKSTELTSLTGDHLLSWVVPATYQYSGKGSYQEGKKLTKERLSLALQRDSLSLALLNSFEKSSYKADISKEILLEFGFISILKAWVTGSVINILAPSVAFSPALRSLKHPSFYKTKGRGIVEKIFNYIKNSSGLLYLSILAAGTIISVVFTMLALVGAFKMTLEFPPVTVITLLILVGYFLAITGPIIGVKYRLPIEPILILFATYFLNAVGKKP
jgi:4-amino-4-deoxy-L-arabinose transferase-like glycosyltransferase